MLHFCTYFDSNYLPRGLALYRSLQRHAADFTLWVLCFDEETCDILSRMDLPNLRLLRLQELERWNSTLAQTRSQRGFVQFMWAFTPVLPLYLFDQIRDMDRVTYLDADLFFFADPAIAADQLGSESILIVGHRHSPEYESMRAISGIYNVGLLSFKNNTIARECLDWWARKCLETTECADGQGQFGDQKYLDDWPSRFAGVKVLAHRGSGVGPWNLRTHPVRRSEENRLIVDDDLLVFYHFHAVKFFSPRVGYVVSYQLPRSSARMVYNPYMREIRRSFRDIRAVQPGFQKGLAPIEVRALISAWRRLRCPLYFG